MQLQNGKEKRAAVWQLVYYFHQNYGFPIKGMKKVNRVSPALYS